MKKYSFKRQPLEMVKHTKTIRWQIVDELFECLNILWGWRLKGYVPKILLNYRKREPECYVG